jgi:hypothetical protein
VGKEAEECSIVFEAHFFLHFFNHNLHLFVRGPALARKNGAGTKEEKGSLIIVRRAKIRCRSGTGGVPCPRQK